MDPGLQCMGLDLLVVADFKFQSQSHAECVRLKKFARARKQPTFSVAKVTERLAASMYSVHDENSETNFS